LKSKQFQITWPVYVNLLAALKTNPACCAGFLF
jgi:hypothetical protein